MATYSQAKNFIKKFRLYEALYNDSIGISAIDNDGMPHGSSVGDPTSAAAIKADEYKRRIDIILAGLVNIPAEYKQGVFAHLVDGAPFPLTAEDATWYRWQQIYVNCVAVLMGKNYY